MKISVFSDLVCPWCYIGKKRILRAIKDSGKEENIQLNMQAFQLYPNIPKTGIEKKAIKVVKKSGYSQNLRNQAAEEGIVFDFGSIKHIPNTLQAHRLVLVSKEAQSEVTNRIFQAYFNKGQDIGKIEVLVDIGMEAGLPHEILAKFATDSLFGLSEVEDQLAESKSLGITAVPSVLIDEQHIISGVLPYTKWQKFLSRL